MDDEKHKCFSKSLEGYEKQTESTHKQHKHRENKHIYIYIYKNYRLFKSPQNKQGIKWLIVQKPQNM